MSTFHFFSTGRPLRIRLLFVFSLTVLRASCTSPTDKNVVRMDRLIHVEGGWFVRDGEPYGFVGTNVWFAANLGSLKKGGDRDRLRRELDTLCDLGVTNLRILGASEGTVPAFTVSPTVQPRPGVFNEDLLDGLDFVLSEMGKRDMQAVVYLNNYWEWSGGMATYVSWVENRSVPHPLLDPNATWAEFMQFSGRFIDHPRANALFRTTIRRLITRKNRYTGMQYRNDPTIMAWQLANEPRPYPGEDRTRHIETFIRWVRSTASFIRRHDPNHLISVGSEGVVGCLQSDSCYIAIHALPQIDYLTFHLWPYNWQWYDPSDPEGTYKEAVDRATAYIEKHMIFARKLNKPLVLEEFGLPRDNHAYAPCTLTSWRDRFFGMLFDLTRDSLIERDPLSGTNFWAWGGEGRARDPEDTVWMLGDDFTGDPPQEPQGRNSVFDSDTSTLKLIRIHARSLKFLSTE